MRVLHISPTYFDAISILGGGERYAYELARAASCADEVVLLSFAASAARRTDGGLRIELLRRRPFGRGRPLATNPWSPRFVSWIRWADVVHCHQVRTLPTDLAILVGRLLGRKVFITDLGGGHRYALSYYLPILSKASGLLLLSEYSRSLWTHAPSRDRPPAIHVVYGGVDPERFSPAPQSRSRMVLFVGRLMPHKGVEYLIEAIRPPHTLCVVGRPYDVHYAGRLRELARGRPVEFREAVDDDELVELYRTALVTVVPSVSRTSTGRTTLVPELLGLVALESMACGTPVIVTAVGSLPEVVKDGETGFVVPPNDAEAIRAKLDWFLADPARADEMGRRGRAWVLSRFTWAATAERCRAVYRV